MAFGGKDNKTLFITDASTGSIHAAKMDVPGRLMYSHAPA
jgi:gluconolactonase